VKGRRDRPFTALLKVERHPPRAAANVENAPPHQPHRLALVGRPGPKRGEVVGRGGCAPHQKAIVALDDLDRPTSLERVEEKPAIGVLLIQERHRNGP
jgi:hypothetical protein